jgi:RNA polymerase sigma-70 factor (ECF subfamily)
MIFLKRKGGSSAGDAGEARASFKAEALCHMEALYNGALYMTRSASEAEDLVQETFLRAFRFWHRYEPGTNCKAWLFRIMTNTFINRNRKRQKAFSLIEEADTDAVSDGLYQGSEFYGSPESQYLGRLFPDHIREAIERLPDNFRIPVVLADLHDFSYKEIADIMDCPVGTVMSRLFRGRKRLQEELFGYAIERGIIDERDARDDAGAISLEAYRARKKTAEAS